MTVEGVSYNFIILWGNLCCFRELGHRARVPTSLTALNPFLALGQVSQLFLVCLDATSGQQFSEGILSILLKAEVQPLQQGSYAYHQFCGFNVECLRGKQFQNKTIQIPLRCLLFILISWNPVTSEQLSSFCGDFNTVVQTRSCHP